MIVDTLEEQILEMISIANMIAETLEEQKEELELSMTESKSQTTLRKEMDKVRKEGKIKEECIFDTHKIIHEAEKRIKEKTTRL